MAWIHINDAHSFVCLGEGFFPSSARLKKRAESLWNQKTIRGLVALPPPLSGTYNDLAAWTANAWTHRLAARRGHSVKELPLETWVLGPPETANAVFADWFKKGADVAGYRVLIHRHPQVATGYASASNVWTDFYDHFPIHHRRGTWKHLKPTVIPYLESVCAAYAQSRDTVRPLVEGSGHVYGFARTP